MTTAGPTDREVILRSLGDPAAFGVLFDRHAAVIHRVMTRRMRNRVAADDVVAETFLRAFERRHRFHADREDALPWLFGFAMHVAREHARREQRLVGQDDDLADARDPLGAATDRIDAQRELEVVLAALHGLPAASRDVVLLHVVGGLSYEDVAAALRIPVGTVRSRLNRSRAKLREGSNRLQPKGGTSRGLEGSASCVL